MGQFDFLNDETPRKRIDRDSETCEHRETGMVDIDGKRISFEVRRMISKNPGFPDIHLRWVSVMKDGHVVRANDSTFHATYAEAEHEVNRKIRNAIARYARQAAGVEPRRKKRFTIAAASTPRRTAKRSGLGCVLVAVAVLSSAAIAAAMLSIRP